jgi:chromosome segregation ATPase
MNGPTRDEVNAKIKANEAEVIAHLTRIDGRIDALASKTETEAAKVMTELHKGKIETLKWVIGLIVAFQAFSIYLYKDVNGQVNLLANQVNTLTEKVSRLDVKINQLDVKIDQVGAKVAQLDVKVDAFDTRFSRLEPMLDQLEAKVERIGYGVNVVLGRAGKHPASSSQSPPKR